MFAPTNTYSVKKVAPIEDLVNYRDKQGNEYVAVSIDFERETWVNKLIEEFGLPKLCEMYPYQPLRVDKETGLLIPINQCDYQAKATNLFHIIYHMKLDAAQDQQQQSQIVEVSSPSQTYGFNVEIQENKQQNTEYSPKWKEAYHLNEGEPNYFETPLKELLVENQEDQEHKYGMTNNGGEIPLNQELPSRPYHPNAQQVPYYSNGYYYQNPYQPYQYISAVQPGSIVPLPSYKLNHPQMTANTFELLGEQSRRAMARDEANMMYANQISNQAKQQNPTLLDTSSSSVDFSNPESVAKMQGMYSNPYYNNLNNPNIQYNQGIQHGIPGNTLVNPFYQQQQQIHQGYVPRYQQPWVAWKFSSVALCEEEKKAGKGIDVRVVPRSQVTKRTYKKPVEEKKEFKVEIVRLHEVHDGNEVIRMTEEEYQQYLKENNGKEVPQDSGRYRYSKSIRSHVIRLADKIAVYDKIIADCLVDCMDDKEYNIDDFLIYVRLVGERYERLKKEEKQHPDRNYRVPYRYKRLPIRIKDPNTGIVGFSRKEEYQEKKTFTFDDGRVIDFFRYDRHREINQDEYDTFYEQVMYERDIEIKLYKFQEMEKAATEEIELYSYDRSNPMNVRLHESKLLEKKRKDQYSIYRAAYKTRMTDEEFDDWWYQNDTRRKSQKPRTDEDIIFETEQMRRNQGIQRQIILQDLGPVDYQQRSIVIQQNIQRAAHEFDEGYMDGCTSLKDFFDRLGYLDMKCHEETIKQQRAEFFRNYTLENKSAYRQGLYELASKVTYDPSEAQSPYQKPTYDDFLKSDEYKSARAKFMDYCANSKGVHFELKPIFRGI